MYWGIFFLILILTIFEIKTKKINSNVFYLVYSILTLFTALRQGQGSDYYNYKEIFSEVGRLTSSSVLPLLLVKDPGYAFLNYIAIQCHISYEIFIALFSVLIMLIAFPFFSNVCKKSMIALFLFYTTSYLVYFFSGVRQGFTLAVLLGVLYPLLVKKKYFRYIVIILFASLIHQSLLVCLGFLFIYRLHWNRKYLLLLTIPFVFVLFAQINILQYIPISFIQARIEQYIENSANSVQYLAIIVRLLVLIPIFLIPESVYENSVELRGVRNIIWFGFLIYTFFSFSDLTASRLNEYTRAFEGLFIVLLIYETKLMKINKQLCIWFMSLVFILFSKNISAFIQQGEYEHCNVLTYPYLSLFDDEETIRYYRKSLSISGNMDFE